MWSAFAFLSAFLRVAQTPNQTCTQPCVQPCRPLLWSFCVSARQAVVKWAQSDVLACVPFLYKNATQLLCREIRSSCRHFLSIFFSYFISFFSSPLPSPLPIIIFSFSEFICVFLSLYPHVSLPRASRQTFFIAWHENALVFSVFRLLCFSPDPKHMNHFYSRSDQASE